MKNRLLERDGIVPELYDFRLLDDDGEIFIPGSAGIYVADKEKLVDGVFEPLAILDSRSGLPASLTANAWNGKDEDKCVFLSADRGVFAHIGTLRSRRGVAFHGVAVKYRYLYLRGGVLLRAAARKHRRRTYY